MGGTAEFGELVSLLSKVAPQKLNSLRDTFPANAEYLKPGAVLGDGQPPDIGCAVAIAALNYYAPAAGNLRLRIRARLAWSRKFDVLAKFAAASGSGGAVGALAAGIGMEKAIIASAIALAGSLCGLLYSYLQRDEASGSVSDAYNRLILALVQCSDLQRTLPLLCKAGDSPQLQQTLGEANETARTLNELILRFP
jgi:hypothetical protein